MRENVDEYGEILHVSPYSVRMRQNADQNNSEGGDFLRSYAVYTPLMLLIGKTTLKLCGLVFRYNFIFKFSCAENKNIFIRKKQ